MFPSTALTLMRMSAYVLCFLLSVMDLNGLHMANAGVNSVVKVTWLCEVQIEAQML